MADDLNPKDFNLATPEEARVALTADKKLKPIKRQKDEQGRWVVRYYLAKDDEALNLSAKDKEQVSNVKAYSDAQRTAAKLVFDRITEQTKIGDKEILHFVPVDNLQEADMRLSAVDFNNSLTGLAPYPVENAPYPREVLVANMNVASRGGVAHPASEFEPGNIMYGTMMHEVLHALGLSHPNNNGYIGGKKKIIDSEEGSAMSYLHLFENQNYDIRKYDRATLQYLYDPASEPEKTNHPSGLPDYIKQAPKPEQGKPR